MAGIEFGRDTADGSVEVRETGTGDHLLFLGGSGSGKSFALKVLVSRAMAAGAFDRVVLVSTSPQDEYAGLLESLGGGRTTAGPDGFLLRGVIARSPATYLWASFPPQERASQLGYFLPRLLLDAASAGGSTLLVLDDLWSWAGGKPTERLLADVLAMPAPPVTVWTATQQAEDVPSGMAFPTTLRFHAAAGDGRGPGEFLLDDGGPVALPLFLLATTEEVAFASTTA